MSLIEAICDRLVLDLLNVPYIYAATPARRRAHSTYGINPMKTYLGLGKV